MQSIFVVALLPFLSKLWGIPFSQLPSYLRDGTACFLNYGTLSGRFVFISHMFQLWFVQGSRELIVLHDDASLDFQMRCFFRH